MLGAKDAEIELLQAGLDVARERERRLEIDTVIYLSNQRSPGQPAFARLPVR